MSEQYVSSWAKSAEKLDKLGIYDEILRNKTISGKNILELGVGTGRMTGKIWMQNPNILLGVDNDLQMLDIAEKYLKEYGFPVKRLSPRVYSVDGKRQLDGDSINLSFANYANYSSFDIDWLELFDLALLSFVGGTDKSVQIGHIVPNVLVNVGPFLKEGGKFVYVDRIICANVENTRPYIETTGYRLEKLEFLENKEAAMASAKGIPFKLDLVCGGKSVTLSDTTGHSGLVERADEVCENFGLKNGIITAEFVKEPI